MVADIMTNATTATTITNECRIYNNIPFNTIDVNAVTLEK
jgi:hypothetical protein